MRRITSEPIRVWFIEQSTTRQTSSSRPSSRDERQLRMLAVEVVEEAGFVAIEARDADEALFPTELRTDITLLFSDNVRRQMI
jgi:hypothetical protein